MRTFSSSDAPTAERDLAVRLAGDLTYEGLRRVDDARWEIRNREEEEKLRQMEAVLAAIESANSLYLNDTKDPQTRACAIANLRTVARLNPQGVNLLKSEDFIEKTIRQLASI